MPVINSLADLKTEAATWRHELHQNPQTSYEETFASGFVKQKLDEWGITYKEGIAVTGVVATIEGQKTSSGKAIGLRADMDALNITEKTNLEHASKNPGKMHACGHDGHTATLLATAKYLSENRNFDGKVHLIFQPAEEGGKGAHTMIDEGLFKDFPCDYVFGYHNWPEMPKGHIGTKIGPLMAATDDIEITVTGAGGHASQPHLTIDSLYIASQIVIALQGIISRMLDPVDTGVISITNFNAGSGANNIIPEVATLTGTLRTYKQETRDKLKGKIEAVTNNIAQAYDATVSINFTDGLDPTVNSADGVEIALRAAQKVVPEDMIDGDCEPCMGAEDFGAYLTKVPGAFIFLGQREKEEGSPHNYGLHSPYYDFNNEIIPIASSYFVAVVEEYMPLDK